MDKISVGAFGDSQSVSVAPRDPVVVRLYLGPEQGRRLERFLSDIRNCRNGLGRITSLWHRPVVATLGCSALVAVAITLSSSNKVAGVVLEASTRPGFLSLLLLVCHLVRTFFRYCCSSATLSGLSFVTAACLCLVLLPFGGELLISKLPLACLCKALVLRA